MDRTSSKNQGVGIEREKKILKWKSSMTSKKIGSENKAIESIQDEQGESKTTAKFGKFQ